VTFNADYVEAVADDYTDLLVRRVDGTLDELTFLRQIRQIVAPEIEPGMSFLDVGCASGYTYKSFAHLGIEYWGFDGERRYLDIARERLEPLGVPPERLVHGDIHTHHFGRTFDVVCCCNTLESLSDFRRPLERLCEWTGRLLIVRTLIDEHTQYLFVKGLNSRFPDLELPNNIYGRHEFVGLMAAGGLRVTEYADEYAEVHPKILQGIPHPHAILIGRRGPA